MTLGEQLVVLHYNPFVTDENKASILEIKTAIAALIDKLDADKMLNPRTAAMAITKLEEAVMLASKVYFTASNNIDPGTPA